MEASLCCGIPPQGVWLEIEQNMPWHCTASTAWALLHSEPPTGPEQSLAALLMPLQLHLVSFFCTKNLCTTLPPLLPECSLFSLHSKHLHTYATFGFTGNSYWEFPHWEFCHQISKGRE